MTRCTGTVRLTCVVQVLTAGVTKTCILNASAITQATQVLERTPFSYLRLGVCHRRSAIWGYAATSQHVCLRRIWDSLQQRGSMHRLAWVLLLLTGTALPACQAKIVIFGDSLSDQGLDGLVSATELVNNRFSTGPVCSSHSSFVKRPTVFCIPC